MEVPAHIEHRLAVITNWAFFASFGFGFVSTGFSDGDVVAGLAGFAAFVLGFIAHIIINRIFSVRFTDPQIALGLGVFGVGAFGFIISWVFDASFDTADIVIGIVGFGAIAACFVTYVIINYGIRESYSMLHRLHMQRRKTS
jgi:hypothetical protein